MSLVEYRLSTLYPYKNSVAVIKAATLKRSTFIGHFSLILLYF